MFKNKHLFNLFSTISFMVFFTGCHHEDRPYRQDMRQLVINIARKARQENPAFIVIPQNGQEVAWDNDEEIGQKDPDAAYLAAIDGIGREDLFFGYRHDNRATPENAHDYMAMLCAIYQKHGKAVLVTDYCRGENSAHSYEQNRQLGFISFAAPERNLTVIPAVTEYFPYQSSDRDITSLAAAKNFLYLINPENFATAADFVNSLAETNYDILLIDLFFDDQPLTAAQVEKLKTKQNGGRRPVICYLSIGEAEDYRWYWRKKAPWLDRENPDWPGNFKVRYWDDEWHNIIYGGENSYLDKILAAGFDGVYLDIIDAYEYFEN